MYAPLTRDLLASRPLRVRPTTFRPLNRFACIIASNGLTPRRCHAAAAKLVIPIIAPSPPSRVSPATDPRPAKRQHQPRLPELAGEGEGGHDFAPLPILAPRHRSDKSGARPSLMRRISSRAGSGRSAYIHRSFTA